MVASVFLPPAPILSSSRKTAWAGWEDGGVGVEEEVGKDSRAVITEIHGLVYLCIKVVIHLIKMNMKSH
jgi:hypothetical protein